MQGRDCGGGLTYRIAPRRTMSSPMSDTPPTPLDVPADAPAEPAPERILSEAAKRALAEAAERRANESAPDLATEHGGPQGPEPTRYGDWEKKGLAVDF